MNLGARSREISGATGHRADSIAPELFRVRLSRPSVRNRTLRRQHFLWSFAACIGLAFGLCCCEAVRAQPPYPETSPYGQYPDAAPAPVLPPGPGGPLGPLPT